jgi:hypothetical protein
MFSLFNNNTTMADSNPPPQITAGGPKVWSLYDAFVESTQNDFAEYCKTAVLAIKPK